MLGRVPGTDGQWADAERHPENETTPGVVVLRVESVRRVVRKHAHADGTRAIVLDGETMPSLDLSATRMLVELSDDLQRRGVRLLMARDVGQVREVLRAVEGDEALRRFYRTIDDAVAAASTG